jgi:hypothetical protein
LATESASPDCASLSRCERLTCAARIHAVGCGWAADAARGVDAAPRPRRQHSRAPSFAAVGAAAPASRSTLPSMQRTSDHPTAAHLSAQSSPGECGAPAVEGGEVRATRRRRTTSSSAAALHSRSAHGRASQRASRILCRSTTAQAEMPPARASHAAASELHRRGAWCMLAPSPLAGQRCLVFRLARDCAGARPSAAHGSCPRPAAAEDGQVGHASSVRIGAHGRLPRTRAWLPRSGCACACHLSHRPRS